MATPQVIYNDADNMRLLYNDYYNAGSGTAERRVWVAPLNPYMIQPQTEAGPMTLSNGLLSTNEVTGRIAMKYEPYFTKLKTSDPRLLLMVYGPVKERLIKAAADGAYGGSGVTLDGSLSNYSDLTAPTSFAVSQFYTDYLAFRNRIESFSNNITSVVTNIVQDGGGSYGGGAVTDSNMFTDGNTTYDFIHELEGKVIVNGPLVCQGGVYFRNFSFRFTVLDNTAIASRSYVPFSVASQDLQVRSVVDGKFVIPTSGFWDFDVAVRVKLLIVGANTIPIQAFLVRSGAGTDVAAWDPDSPAVGTSVVAAFVSCRVGDTAYPNEDTCKISCKSYLKKGDVLRVYVMCASRLLVTVGGNDGSMAYWTGALVSNG